MTFSVLCPVSAGKRYGPQSHAGDPGRDSVDESGMVLCRLRAGWTGGAAVPA